MTLRDLEREVRAELEAEQVETAKAVMKELLREIQIAERVERKLKAQWKDLMKKDVAEIAQHR
jgi:hypothetical protein